MSDQLPRIQLQIPIDVKPVFANDVNINTQLKGTKTGRVTAVIRLQFFDRVTNRVLGDIAIDTCTAEALAKILNDKLIETDRVIKSKNPEKEIKDMTEKPTEKSTREETDAYTG